MFFGVWGLFWFLYFGVGWKGRIPALKERGLFGFGFCVPSDIALEKRPRSGSDGSWPFLNGVILVSRSSDPYLRLLRKSVRIFVVSWKKGRVLAVTKRYLFG